MAMAATKSVQSLMQKTLERHTATAQLKFRIKEKQVENIMLSYVEKHNSAPYNELIKVLKEYPLNDQNFKNLIEDCLSCVMLLDRQFGPFLDIVYNIEWVSRTKELVQLYSKFILNLVTAHTYHCERVLANLAMLFKANGAHWDDSPTKEMSQTWSNVHKLIAQIIAVMPMTSKLLIKTIENLFPYFKAGSYVNRAYVHNLIWISKYIPSLREQIMTVIISRMLEMDVNVVDRAKNKPQGDTVFEMEVDETDEVADTLDYCMLEMLKWLEDEREPIMKDLVTIFMRYILPTYGIGHVQFLLLYTVSINQQCADSVLNNLWVVAAGLHESGPGAVATRRTAASHLAGLLARCVRVPNTRLIKYLKCMAEWCHSYITATQESTAATDNTKVHGAFYAICHSIFYLIAFKHQHLFSSKESVSFVESLNLPRMVTCALNPLRSCPPQVTHAFSSVTRSHQVAYCQPIIEKNSRHSLQVTTVHYDDWFPYDPYSLTRSGSIIWPLCIEYKNWAKGSVDETQYSSMKRKLITDDDDFLMASSPMRLSGSLSNCISPGFKTSETVM